LRLAALFSGGKDSTCALDLVLADGHDVSHLVTAVCDRRDSYMFQTAGVELAALAAEAIGIPHVVVRTSGVKEEEIAPLESALAGLDVEGVVSGAIRSRYQRDRIDALCGRLGLASLAPLWHTDMSRVERMVADYEVIVVAVASMGLGPEWLGRRLDAQAVSELRGLADRYGINADGEGGEFETSVLSGPNFGMRVEIFDSEVVWEGDSGYMVVRDAGLVEVSDDVAKTSN